MPTVLQFTTINFTLSLSTDRLAGPYTTSVSITAGVQFTIRLNQLTAGPCSNVSLSFGDGSSLQNYTLKSSFVNISYVYTKPGTYQIAAFPLAQPFNVTVNNMKVMVTAATTTSTTILTPISTMSVKDQNNQLFLNGYYFFCFIKFAQKKT
jgi:hypothetical protein